MHVPSASPKGQNGKPLPIADVAASGKKSFNKSRTEWNSGRAPSSRMSNLLPLTIARASAKICRWPTERLPPPLAIWLSSVRRPSSSSLCREKSPEARNAPFSVASSHCENGSRFSRNEPLSNSGYVDLVGQRRGEVLDGLTIWGMMVMFERRASRLMELVSLPS